MYMEMIDFDKSLDKDDEVEFKTFIFQTKGKYINIWIYIVSTDILLVFINKIKDELNRRILY